MSSVIRNSIFTDALEGSWIGVEYATVCPFSSSNRWLLLQYDGGDYGLYTGDGVFQRMLDIRHDQEPRWDSDDSNLLYYINGNEIRQYWIYGDYSIPAYIFTEYTRVQSLGEGDIENNSIALLGTAANGDREIFLFDVAHATKSIVMKLDAHTAPNNIYATPSGNMQVGYDGVYLYGSDMALIRRIAACEGHNDVARYSGHDITLWCSSNDAEINENALMLIEHDTGVKRKLIQFDWRYAFHVSACDTDFCLVSTYTTDNSLPSQLWQVWFDGRSSLLVADTKTVYRNYNSQPKAALSRDGSRAVYNVDNGKTVNVCMLRLDNQYERTRIDYSAYVGKSIFEMVPRADGAVDIYERKVV